MVQYIIKRLLLLPLLLFIFSVFAFVLIQAPPGDFVTSYIAELAASGSSVDQAQIEALRSMYGLDQPMYIQYFHWVGRMLHGDLGRSIKSRRPVMEDLRAFLYANRLRGDTAVMGEFMKYLPITVSLTLAASLLVALCWCTSTARVFSPGWSRSVENRYGPSRPVLPIGRAAYVSSVMSPSGMCQRNSSWPLSQITAPSSTMK